jgi:hypothetical protein
MSIIDITEEIKSSTCDISANAEGSWDCSGQRDFLVLFSEGDTPELRPYMARDTRLTINGCRIPAIWEAHPYDANTYVISKSVAMYAGPFCWKVTVNYKYIPDPLLEPYTVDWLFSSCTEPIDKDKSGAALVNSAGEPFDPPIQEEFNDLVLRITRNEAAYDPALASEYKKAVNSDQFLWFEPYTVRCNLFEGRRIRIGNLFYYQVNYEFIIRQDPDADGNISGWKRRILDQGFREKTGTDEGKPTYALILDDNGTPINQPALLDGSGSKLDDAADPYYFSFETKPSKSFAFFRFLTTDYAFSNVIPPIWRDPYR